MVKLIKLNKEYEIEYIKFINEFLSNNEEVIPTSAYEENKSFEEFLKITVDYENDILDNPNYVGAHTYFLLREEDNKIIGAINIRHELNEFLFNYGGHIGYGIRPSERKKGYATKMLELALDKCKELDIYKVLITCDKENIGSSKTIVNNGGILENEVSEDSRVTLRYWIDISKKR